MKKLLLLLTLFSVLQTKATHVTGGEITTRCLGGLTQEITTTLYVDIQGIPMPNTISVTYTSNNFTWAIFRTTPQQSQTPVNGTITAYTFVDTVTVPYLDYYTFSYATCCRPATLINTSSGFTPLYIESIILVDTSCNSTPIFPIVQLPYAVVNSQSTYNLNVYDPDGDSLGFQLVTPLEDAGLQLSGYITPPITISNTGVLTVNANTVGVYVFDIKVTEYRNGVEIGHVLREMQIPVTISNSIEEIKTTLHQIDLKIVKILSKLENGGK